MWTQFRSKDIFVDVQCEAQITPLLKKRVVTPGRWWSGSLPNRPIFGCCLFFLPCLSKRRQFCWTENLSIQLSWNVLQLLLMKRHNNTCYLTKHQRKLNKKGPDQILPDSETCFVLYSQAVNTLFSIIYCILLLL